MVLEGVVSPVAFPIVLGGARTQFIVRIHQYRFCLLMMHERNELENVISLLEDLPKRVRQPTMVPLGPHAFFPGELIHTNEVLVRLGSSYFVRTSAFNAQQIVRRRLEGHYFFSPANIHDGALPEVDRQREAQGEYHLTPVKSPQVWLKYAHFWIVFLPSSFWHKECRPCTCCFNLHFPARRALYCLCCFISPLRTRRQPLYLSFHRG